MKVINTEKINHFNRWKKGKNLLSASVISLALLFPNVANVAYAEDNVVSQTFTFPESSNQSQQQSILINDLGQVRDVIVDSGTVSYTQNGRTLHLTLKNSSPDRQQYNAYKYNKTGTSYQTSSSQYGFNRSIYYYDGSYTGTIYQSGSPYVISGFAPQQKWVSAQTSSWYNDGMYSGYLSQYIYNYSSGYTLTKSVSQGPYSGTIISHWKCVGGTWSRTTTDYRVGGTFTMPYSDSDGYSGTLYLSGSGGAPQPSGTCSVGQTQDTTASGSGWYFNGTVSKTIPSTPIYRYQGWVNSSDTRTWRQDYSGTVYQGGYDDFYQYKVTVTYAKDVTKPVLSLTYNDSTLSHEVSVTVKGIDSESGVKQVTLPNGSVVQGNQSAYTISNNGNYTFKVEDWAGNVETQTVQIRNIDNDKPNAPTIQGNFNWSNTTQTVTILHNGDNGVAGVGSIEYSFNKELDNNWTKYSSPIMVSEEGINTIMARVIDKAGNASIVASQSVKIDKSNPVLNVAPNIQGLTNTDVILNAVGSDNLSGMKRIKLPNRNYVNGDNTNYLVGENGTYVFEAEDNVGNKTRFTTIVKNIKKNVLITNNPTVDLELHAEDLLSGVTTMRLKNDDKAWTSWEHYSTYKEWILSSVDGLKHVWVQYVDKVGNQSEAVEDIIILDTTKPVVHTVKINKGDSYTKTTNVKLVVNSSDSYTGMKDMYISNDNKNWKTIPYTPNEVDWVLSNGEGTKTVYVKTSDTAGNISDVRTDTIFFDATKPLANIVINNGDAYTPTRDVKLTLTYSDIGGSGVETVKVIEGNTEYVLPKPVPNSPTAIPWTLDFGISKTVSIIVIDKAGNISNTSSATIVVDKLAINRFTLEDVVNPLEFNDKNPFVPKVWAFSPQPMLSGGNITFGIDVKSAFEPEMVQDKVEYKVEVVSDGGYHKAFVGTMRKAGNRYSQTITIPKDAPNGAKVYVSATAQRKLLVSPYDNQTVYFPGGEDVSQKAQIGVVGGNIYDVIRFNEIQ